MTGRSERVVRVARAWIGTPYRHQASCRGAGCDCLGLLRGIWRELYGAEPCDVPPYSRDWSEPSREESMLEAASAYLEQRAPGEVAPGDVIVFRMREHGVAKHVALQGETGTDPTFIHAYERHGVLESPLSGSWARRIVARFSFPEEVR